MAIPPNLKIRNRKFCKVKSVFSKIKFGGCSCKGMDIGQLEVAAKSEKYMVPGIYDRNMKKGKFAKQMNQQKFVEVGRIDKKNENPCKWCVNAICEGFYYGEIFLDINHYRVNIITIVYEIYNSRNRKE